MGKHFLAALLAEGFEALAAQLVQRVALGVAQFVAADQAVGAIAIGGDAVEGEPGPPCAAQDPAGHVLRWGRAATPQQFQPLRGSLRLEHERLVDGAHAHPLGDERAQAKEGSRGAGGHGVMVAAAASPAPGVAVPAQSLSHSAAARGGGDPSRWRRGCQCGSREFSA